MTRSAIERLKLYRAVTPVSDDVSLPWVTALAPLIDQQTAAVFLGGDKDGAMAACVLAEILTPTRLRLSSMMVPRPDAELTNPIEWRQEALMLRRDRDADPYGGA